MIAAVAPFALAAIIARCAPRIGAVTMSAIVAYESGDRPYAIGDNTVRRSYFPSDLGRAETIAASLVREGHSIDVGYAQINIANISRFGLGLRDAFDPCTNVATGARLLEDAYAGARRTFGPGQVALGHALSVYNTGGYFAGLAYARGVYAMAATLRHTASTRSHAFVRRAVSFEAARASIAAR